MLGEAVKEKKMGLTEFPRMQFPCDHEMTEKLVMAKDEPKRKEISDTHLFCFLYPPRDRANVCYTVLYCCVTPCLHTSTCSSFEREAGLKGLCQVTESWGKSFDAWVRRPRSFPGAAPVWAITLSIPDHSPVTSRAFLNAERNDRAWVERCDSGELVMVERKKILPLTISWRNWAQTPGL